MFKLCTSTVQAPFLDDKSYLLIQGPLPETTRHFWTMVWQQQVSAIVMLCRLMETGICKCYRYWPATQEEDDLIAVPEAGLEVRLRDFEDNDDFLVIFYARISSYFARCGLVNIGFPFAGSKSGTASLRNRLNPSYYTVPLLDLARLWSPSFDINFLEIFAHGDLEESIVI